jgi:hypothetical protein
MKKLVFLIITGITSLAWGGEELTVQVISAVYEKSITPAFDVKLKKTGLPIHKKVEDSRYVVTLGGYNDEKQAEKARTIARQFVVKDAFIRPVNRHRTAVVATQTKTTQAVTHTEVAQTKSAQPATHIEAKVDTTAAIAVIEAPKSEKSTAPIVTDTAKKPVSVVVTTLSECDKKEMRMDALAEAIRFYKNSPYHRFEPVVLRQ